MLSPLLFGRCCRCRGDDDDVMQTAASPPKGKAQGAKPRQVAVSRILALSCWKVSGYSVRVLVGRLAAALVVENG